MAKLYNLARVQTATTGTGTITLGSAVSGYLTFALAGVANGEVVSYGIKDGANSEIGTGTYTSSGTTLTRTVTKSTNANAAITLSGAAEVFITARAEDIAPDDVRQNSLLTAIYQSKAFAGYRRMVNLFADGYKASDGINSGSSTNYSVNTGSGYVAPTTSADTWSNEISQTFNANLTGFAGFANRQLLPAGAAANGDKIRLTLTPPSTGNNTNITDVFIGQGGTAPNYGSTPTRVTFNGGSSSVTLTAGGSTVVSDEIVFSYNASLTTTIGILFSGAASDVRQLTGLGSTYNTYQKGSASVSDINAATGSGFSANSGFMQVVSKVEARTAAGSPNNMTVITTAQTADSSVSFGRALLEFDNSASPTLNTDLTVELTANGGTNWATATLSSVTTNSQGGRKVIETADTALTAGTSFAARIKTLNSKNVPVYGAAVVVH